MTDLEQALNEIAARCYLGKITFEEAVEEMKQATEHYKSRGYR